MEDKDNVLVYRLGHSDLYCAVAASLNLSEIKLLHAKWIYKMYEYLQGRSDLVLKGFESAWITEAVQKSNEVFERIENPFLASRNDKN